MKLKHVFVRSKLNQGHLETRNYGEKLAAIPLHKYFMMIEQCDLHYIIRHFNMPVLERQEEKSYSIKDGLDQNVLFRCTEITAE